MNEENSLVKKIDLQAAPFSDDFKELTKGQKAIYNLITQKIKEQSPITINDIKSCYYDAVSRGGQLYGSNYDSGTYRECWYNYPKEKFMDDYYFPRAKSLQWFKSNLGACIIKGKILAIPIIELNENNGKETNT